MTTPTTRTAFHSLSFHASARARREPRRRHVGPPARGSALASTVLACAGALCCATGIAHETAHARRAASAPRTTADALGPPPAPGLYAPAPANDGAVYRCGNSYSAQACGAARPLDVDDARTWSQRMQADDAAARDKRLAAWLQAQREQRDAPASAPGKPRRSADSGCVSTRLVPCPVPRTRNRRAVPLKKPKAPAVTASSAAR